MKIPELNRGRYSLLIYLFVLIAIIILLRNAWICDDAYISFRTVDNFTHGHGLTWNIDERVQAFTNPLWVFLISLFYLITNELYYTSIIVSLVLTLLTILLAAQKISGSITGGILAIVLMISSKAFVDYSTSGLETPLNYLILSGFYYIFISYKPDKQTFFVLSLIAALGTLNRMDTILLYAPVLIYLFFRLRSLKTFYMGLLGFSPFILWEIFSLLYYGFPFPNTYYAKLHSGITQSELFVQGLVYYWESFKMDPLTLIIVFSGIGVTFIRKDKDNIPFVLGIIIYLLYIIRIGGDFMGGRFFALPFLGAVFLISRISFGTRWQYRLIPFGAVLILIFLSPRSPILSGADYSDRIIYKTGVTDERGYYFQMTGLFRNIENDKPLHENLTEEGRQLRSEGTTFDIIKCVGFSGFYAGPQVHIYEEFALTEPLLARLPTCNRKQWRIGHFARCFPWGHRQSLETGKNLIEDPNLKEYYDKILTITRGDIFDLKRWGVIVKMNLGCYDYLLDDYNKTETLEKDYSEVNSPAVPGQPGDSTQSYIVPFGGLHIKLDSIHHDKMFEFDVDRNDIFYIQFNSDTVNLGGFSTLDRVDKPDGFLTVDTLRVSKDAQLSGYDNIYITPVGGEAPFYFGYFRLLK